MLDIQSFLRGFSNPEIALSELDKAFYIRNYNDNGLVSFNYTHCESPSGVEIVNEARGLILEYGTWDVVAYPFRRFLNASEGFADDISVKNSTLFSKVDGSIVFCYPYRGKHYFATRGRPRADGNISNSTKTFNDLVYQAINLNNYDVPRLFSTKDTFIFELTSPENRVVTPYYDYKLTLLGARKAESLEEYSFAELKNLSEYTGIDLPQTYRCDSIDDAKTMAARLPQMEEGYVLVDYSKSINGSFHRVKIKNPKWLSIHSIIGNCFTEKRAFEIYLKGESTEFLAYYPEYKELFSKVENFIEALDKKLESDYNSISHLVGNRKEFALEAKNKTIPSYMFMKLDGKINSTKEFLANYNIDKLMEMFKK